MDKLLNIVSQLQIADDFMSREITEVESLSNKISEFADVYKKNCDELHSKSNEIENLKAQEIALYAKITEREKDFANAMKELEDLESEFHSVSKYESFLNWTGKGLFENSEIKSKLYGIQIEAQYLEPTICQVKINLACGGFVVFNVDKVQNSYDLQAVEPKTAHYEEIRTFLLQSGDIAGFLCHVRKFFSRMM